MFDQVFKTVPTPFVISIHGFFAPKTFRSYVFVIKHSPGTCALLQIDWLHEYLPNSFFNMQKTTISLYYLEGQKQQAANLLTHEVGTSTDLPKQRYKLPPGPSRFFMRRRSDLRFWLTDPDHISSSCHAIANSRIGCIVGTTYPWDLLDGILPQFALYTPKRTRLDGKTVQREGSNESLGYQTIWEKQWCLGRILYKRSPASSQRLARCCHESKCKRMLRPSSLVESIFQHVKFLHQKYCVGTFKF